MRRRATLFALSCALLLVGCSRGQTHADGGEDASDAGPTGEPLAFDCTAPDGTAFRFTVEPRADALALWLPDRFGGRPLVLAPVRAASGAKYAAEDVVVWTKGDEARLEVEGAVYEGCALAPQRSPWAEARSRGVDVRAVGNEPGWHLDLYAGDRIRFVYAYGAREAAVPAPEPTTDAEGQTLYHAETEAHTLTVTLQDAPCTDTMSGEAFPLTVTVALDGQTFRGCGRALGPDD